MKGIMMSSIMMSNADASAKRNAEAPACWYTPACRLQSEGLHSGSSAIVLSFQLAKPTQNSSSPDLDGWTCDSAQIRTNPTATACPGNDPFRGVMHSP